MRDLYNSIDSALSVVFAAKTATANGTTVDLQGYESCVAIASFGTWTDGTHTYKLQDSPDNVTFTDVAAGFLLGAFTAVSAAGGSNTQQRVGYIGYLRYLRAVLTVAGATTGAVSGCEVIRSRKRHKVGPAV